MTNWITLITSLPTENATARMRIWRNLKASGAAVLRDGVYLLPEQSSCRATVEAVAAEVLSVGGTALVLSTEEPQGTSFTKLFDRSEDYTAILTDIAKAREGLTADSINDTLKQARKLRKTFSGLVDIDFFPGEARRQADAALVELERIAAQALSPDEPHPVERIIPSLSINDYRGRTWATRRRPWIDRLASAWLIRRFIDPDARLLWLNAPADCPSDALGFDFDGATFSHVGSRVTFEVLMASFGLDSQALLRIGAIVHFLDVGGVQPPESAGIESVLAGLRESIDDDNQLLSLVGSVFDGLLVSFEKAKQTP